MFNYYMIRTTGMAHGWEILRLLSLNFFLFYLLFLSWTGEDMGHDIDENWGHDYYQPDESDAEAAKKGCQICRQSCQICRQG